jgi:CheY-like chemotaxis protein
VIFLDVLMPAIDGWQVLKALKSDPATAAIPVVMLSVLDDANTAREKGAAALITKPLDTAKLKAVLKTARDAANAKPASPLAMAG